MSIQERVQDVQARIRAAEQAAGRPEGSVTLVAATKVQTDETIRTAITAGITVCGENRVQEFNAHYAAGAYEGADVQFIGHLQKNKVKYLVGKVSLIQSVDSAALLEAISARAERLGLVQDVLIEVNIGEEASKSGVRPEDAATLLALAGTLPGVRARGLMAIPPVSREPGGNRPFFAELYQLFVDIKGQMGDNNSDLDCLSMGMSGDFEDAIAEGATMVRVGTALFGPRPPMRQQG
ncbi:MAG: YggS family pyridoxal phosphate-dependent enzyme [Clostridiales bacterium]|nr:YggS family pyridoxal phosphate-dependent enzyme [Clostridiales bacterium]